MNSDKMPVKRLRVISFYLEHLRTFEMEDRMHFKPHFLDLFPFRFCIINSAFLLTRVSLLQWRERGVVRDAAFSFGFDSHSEQNRIEQKSEKGLSC